MPRSKTKGPVKVGGCIDRDCANNKHCFRPRRQKGETLPVGPCIGCGETPVDFDRVHRRDEADRQYTIKSMRLEKVRDDLWRRPFNERSLEYARKRGVAMLCAGAVHKVEVNIGKAAGPWDGRAIPLKQERMRTPYDYAFHATGACCRRCAEYWHGIPPNRPLSSLEVMYLGGLVSHYLQERLPSALAEEKVPELVL